MAATINDLATRVLQKLRVLSVGQTAYPEDMEIARQKIRAAHASFRKDERVRWTISSLPEAAEEPYVMLAAYLCAPEFRKQADQMWVTFAEREINAVIQTPTSGAPIRTEYF